MAKRKSTKDTTKAEQRLVTPRDGEPIRVRRDLYEVRKRLVVELENAQRPAENEAYPTESAIMRAMSIRMDINYLGVQTYPSFLDEKKRGTLFVEGYQSSHYKYLASFDDMERGTIEGAVVIELGVQGSGNFKLHCLFSEVAYYSLIEESENVKNWSNWKSGPALLYDPEPNLARSHRPPDGAEVQAKILDVIVQGTYHKYDDYIQAKNGPILFCIATSWQILPHGDTHTGPFAYLESPKSWHDLPEGGWRPALEAEAVEEMLRIAEKNQQQLDQRKAFVRNKLKEANSDEERIRFLNEHEILENDIGELPNPSYFPLRHVYLSWIDEKIEHYKATIALRYKLQRELGGSERTSSDTTPVEDDSSVGHGPYSRTVQQLAQVANMSESGVRTAIREQLKIREVTVHFIRNEGKNSQILISEKSFERIERKMSEPNK